jgi:cytochrome b561
MHPAHVPVLDDTCSWAEFVCASVLLRLGTSGVTTALRHVLEDTMGTSAVIKIHTLLYTFTGILIVLGMMICKFFLPSTKQTSSVSIM